MKFERVDADLAAGRLWKARDRLQGMRMHAPAEQEVLERLGRVAADMGDLPAAGLAWFLTDGDDARREEAFAAMRSRHGGPHALVAALAVRAPLDAFPPGVQERVSQLQAQLGGLGFTWDPARHRNAVTRDWPEETMRQKVTGGIACMGAFAIFAIVFVVPWLRGLLALFD